MTQKRTKIRNSAAGFTILELLIGIGILLLVTGIGSLYLTGMRSSSGVENSARKLVGLLSAAQEKSISQEGGSRWGVYIDNRPSKPIYSLYQVNEVLLALGDSTIPGTTTESLSVELNTNFASPTPSTYANIIFAKGTGIPNASTSIIFEQSNDAANQESVLIQKTGHIQFLDTQ